VAIEPSAGSDVAGRWSACYAPHSSMYLDQFGKVRACCQNGGFSLGDVTSQSLREIWESSAAESMRSALERDDYSAGCDFCEWQTREGNTDIVFARNFDDLRPAARRPDFPRQMEFALTNTCNLQCAMCNGNWSSAIRSRREGRPPLESVYGESFFAELAEFLPHLDEARFLGGEPFLGAEPLRVLEMLAELPRRPRVTITTNGTIFTPRVERLLERLRPEVVVSIDGASSATFDRIRVGARFDEVLENLDRFRSVLGSHKVSIAHCLMPDNWHEFADLLLLAEQRDLVVGVNVVRFPPEHSLYHLPADQLARVLDQLRSADPALAGPRRAAWDGHVGALARRHAAVQAGVADDGLEVAFLLPDDHPTPVTFPPQPTTPRLSRWQWLPFPEHGPVDPSPGALPDSERLVAFDIGTDGIVHLTRADEGAPIAGEWLDGRTFEELVERIVASYGSTNSWTGLPRRLGRDDNTFAVRLTQAGDDPAVWWVAQARRDRSGALIGARHLVGSVDIAAFREQGG
jgi:radical SAM protein with 4Fe4S-binding SPASM domain